MSDSVQGAGVAPPANQEDELRPPLQTEHEPNAEEARCDVSGAPSPAPPTPPRSVIVIIGGGIIGACSAFYLSERLKACSSSSATTQVMVVERYQVAGCASGKAGGFLARGWGDSSPTQQLHHTSFDLHEKLAAQLGLATYRKLETLQVRPKRGRSKAASAGASSAAAASKALQPAPLCPWLNGAAFDAEHMDPTTAQVSPYEFTTRIMAAAVANGVEVVKGRVVGVEVTAGGSSRVAAGGGGGSKAAAATTATDSAQQLPAQTQRRFSVRLQGLDAVLAADVVVVAMGPWSVEVSCDWGWHWGWHAKAVVVPGPRAVLLQRMSLILPCKRPWAPLCTGADLCVFFLHVLCAQAAKWFAELEVPMEGLHDSSIVFRNRPLAATALFCAENELGCDIECYPRCVCACVCMSVCPGVGVCVRVCLRVPGCGARSTTSTREPSVLFGTGWLESTCWWRPTRPGSQPHQPTTLPSPSPLPLLPRRRRRCCCFGFGFGFPRQSRRRGLRVRPWRHQTRAAVRADA
jgi:hypothetical protein